MSRRSRCRLCAHTPARTSRDCGCVCHATAPAHGAYSATPASRAPSKATGQGCLLGVRAYGRSPAPHVPAPLGYRRR